MNPVRSIASTPGLSLRSRLGPLTKRSIWSRVLVLLLLTGWCGGCRGGCGKTIVPQSPSRPNIILIVIDTARADHFSCYGYQQSTSPHIDRLARQSVLFSTVHSTAPWTLPAHMSIFTGLFPGQHGATFFAFRDDPDMTFEDLMAYPFTVAQPRRLLAHRMLEAGYRTCGFSTNAWVGTRTGMAHGFEQFHEVWQPAVQEVCRMLPAEFRIREDFDQTNSGRAIALFKKFIAESDGSTPFFAFFNLMDPHFTYTPPDAVAFRFEGERDVFCRMLQSCGVPLLEGDLLTGKELIASQKITPFYDAEIAYVDALIGHMIASLRQHDIYENTLIIVTTDHGEHLGEDGRYSHQLSIEEELLRVPLLIKYPRNRDAGTIHDNNLVSNLDIYQTVLAAGDVTDLDRFASTSQDLSRMDTFSRNMLLAEYYFSEPYLAQLININPAFDIDPHKVVRRAVFTREGKFSFENDTLTNSLLWGQSNFHHVAPTVDTREVRDFLLEYIRSIESVSPLERGTASPDTTSLEQLRALGYVHSDDESGTSP